ncbi:YdgH/BhsA/McbA-like domain containing protein [Pantoea septica]|uniref:YdgH/BhsA/McbA-like domain containing protein n=1 Tax=Pantoea septica TaxID=472695 RepID=UPI0023F178C9|nr:YdgH/BhsA/McbA-like domain containing protein [Pantoea septica]
MKTKSLIALATLTAALSFGANAASLVSNQQAETLQPLNQTISISGHDGDQTNIRQALSQKADAQGASHYRIIENNQDDTYHVTAELYK